MDESRIISVIVELKLIAKQAHCDWLQGAVPKWRRKKKKSCGQKKKKKKSDRGIKKTADLQAFWQENVNVGCDSQCSKNSREMCKYVGLVEVLALHTGHTVLILYIYTQFMCTHTLSSAQRISKSMHCWYVKAHYFSMPCAAAMLSKLLWGP